MSMLYRVIIILILILAWHKFSANAQYLATDTLSVKVYFPCASSDMTSIADNAFLLDQFIHRLDSLCLLPQIMPLGMSVTSSASPEGNLKFNHALSRARAKALLNYLNSRSENFRNIYAAISCHINEQTTNDKRAQIQRSHYPSLRFSEVVLHLQHRASDTLAVAPPAEEKTAIGDSVVLMPIDTPTDSITIQQPSTDVLTPTAQPVSQAMERCPVLFVKSNLLYDLLTCINASVEVPLGRNITAEATIVYPWWRSTSRHKTVQMRYVAVTPRYYFSNADTPYTNWFAGLTVGAGTYDLQWTRRGVQGNLWHISPTIGYSHHIGKSQRWKMEYSASAGFIQTKYKKYTQIADTPYGEIKVRDYPWVTKVLNTVLPTSLNVSLVYTFTSSKPARHHAQ